MGKAGSLSLSAFSRSAGENDMASFWTVTLALAEGLGATAKLFVLTLSLIHI